MKLPSQMGRVFENGRWVDSVINPATGRALGTKKHPKLDGKRYAMLNGRKAHIARAEKALGRRMRGTEVVHHVDPADKYRSEGPLVVCPDQTYHALIEMRGKALRECGNANWQKCRKCLKWDDPANMQTKLAQNGTRQMQKYWHYRFRGQCVNKGDRCETRRHSPRPKVLRRDPAALLAFRQSDAPVRIGGDADRCECGETQGKFLRAPKGGRYYCTGCGKQKRGGFVSRSKAA